jgi:hypothetical protein
MKMRTVKIRLYEKGFSLLLGDKPWEFSYIIMIKIHVINII